MTVLVNADTRLLVQGITGKAARHHTANMLAYGTCIVAGVRPEAGGQQVHGIPVFDQASTAVQATAPNAAVLFVPALAMKSAALEVLSAGIKLLVMVSEHVPLHDTMTILAHARQCQARVIGPNTPGILNCTSRCKIGFLPDQYYCNGPVGVASRSGTLTYELVARLSAAGIGQSTCVGVGGDPMVGTTFAEMARMFQQDPDTQVILLIGEVGGTMEEEVAQLVVQGVITKPVVFYIAGRSAPEGKRMGHAGAIVAGGRGSIASKLQACAAAGIPVAPVLSAVVPLVRQALTKV